MANTILVDHLYVRKGGRFEGIPVGFSFAALLFGPFWAAANGLIIEFTTFVGITTVAALIIAVAIDPNFSVLSILGMAIGLNYLARIARRLRAKVCQLCRSGRSVNESRQFCDRKGRPISMSDTRRDYEPYSTLTCPECGYRSRELMPVNACQYFYNCKGCGISLKPKAGDCCVYCTYGDVKCPPIQQGDSCRA